MKKIIIFTFLLVVAIVPSCHKEGEGGIKKEEVRTNLSSTKEYRFRLKQFIKNGGFPLITKAPNHYNRSRIVYGDQTVGPVYEYITDLPPGGRDTVIIKIVKEHEHDPSYPDEHDANDYYTSVILSLYFLIQ